MNPQLQLWMPAVLSLFGVLIVVVMFRSLSQQMRLLESKLDARLD